MSPLTEDFRSPFATSVLLGLAVGAVAFIVSLTLIFIDINDHAVPEWVYQGANRETFLRLRNNLPPDGTPAVALVNHYGKNPEDGAYYTRDYNHGGHIKPGY